MERPYFLSPRILSRSFFSRASVSAALSCGAHWKGVLRLGHEAADGDRAADVVLAGDLAALGDHVDRHVTDLEDVLVGLGGQAAHEVQLHLTPAVAVRGGHRPDQVLLGDHLVDDLAHPLGAALGGEGETGAAAVAGQLVGQVHVERVDAGGGQREAHLVVGVAVGEALGDVADLAVVRGGEGEQADLFEAGRLEALVDHFADAGDASLRTGRVIMPAWQKRQPRVQPRKISTDIRSCTVSASGTRGCLG